MTVVPHEGFKAVFAAAVGIMYMTGYALKAWVFFNKGAENLVLLFI